MEIGLNMIDKFAVLMIALIVGIIGGLGVMASCVGEYWVNGYFNFYLFLSGLGIAFTSFVGMCYFVRYYN